MLLRTGKTTLTDNELILFDALWDADCAWWMLRQREFEDFMLTYTHNMSDAELVKTLGALQQRGLLREYLYVYAENGDKRYFGLTPESGALWEAEREPIWDKYVSAYVYDGRYVVESPSLEIARQYMRVMQQVDSAAPEQVIQIDKPNYRLLSWKDFPMVYEFSGGIEQESGYFDWDGYLNELDWWRDIHELDWLK
jgi:hypothetical protein